MTALTWQIEISPAPVSGLFVVRVADQHGLITVVVSRTLEAALSELFRSPILVDAALQQQRISGLQHEVISHNGKKEHP